MVIYLSTAAFTIAGRHRSLPLSVLCPSPAAKTRACTRTHAVDVDRAVGDGDHGVGDGDHGVGDAGRAVGDGDHGVGDAGRAVGCSLFCL